MHTWNLLDLLVLERSFICLNNVSSTSYLFLINMEDQSMIVGAFFRLSPSTYYLNFKSSRLSVVCSDEEHQVACLFTRLNEITVQFKSGSLCWEFHKLNRCQNPSGILKMSLDIHDEGPGFVGIKFCQECNNMLYPKEDKDNRQLLFACRNCDFQQVWF